jgi:outer membrane protein assembly factor BamB
VCFRRTPPLNSWTTRWEVDDGVVNGEPTPAAVTDDYVLVHVRFPEGADDRLEARAVDTGDVRWTATRSDEEPAAFGPPIVVGDRVFLRDADLRVLDLETGEQQGAHATPESWEWVVADGPLFFTDWSRRDQQVRVVAW